MRMIGEGKPSLTLIQGEIMRILFMKKSFVGGKLYDAGQVADVDAKTAELYAPVAKALDKPVEAKVEEKKVEKPVSKPISKPIKKAKK